MAVTGKGYEVSSVGDENVLISIVVIGAHLNTKKYGTVNFK